MKTLGRGDVGEKEFATLVERARRTKKGIEKEK